MANTNHNFTRFSEATTECHRIASTFFDARISRMLSSAEKVFIGFAEKAESDKLQTQFIDAINLVKHSSETILSAFDKAFQQGFDDLGIPLNQDEEVPAGDWGSMEEWSLIENSELSENVVAMNIIEEAENTNFSELYALHQRFSLATGGKVLEYEKMPVGPHRIVSSFRRAIDSIELDQRIRLVLYTLFRDYVLKDLGAIYPGMNQTLREAGILPNLKRIVSKHQSPAVVRDKPVVPGNDFQGDSPATTEQRTPYSQQHGLETAATAPSSEDLFESIVELMSLKNPNRWKRPSHYLRSIGHDQSPAGNSGASPAGTGTAIKGAAGGDAPSHSVVETIDRIVQEGASSMSSEPITDQKSAIALAQDPTFVERTIETLSREREQIISAVPPQQMQPLDVQIIDIIGMLFEHMLNDDRLPNIAKAVLSRLQTPYLKAALIDKQLLHDSDHPGRKLLNLLVESGEDFVNEQSPDWGVFPAMRETVEEITRNFKNDIQIFVRAYDDLKPKVEAQKRKINTLESRSKQIVQGRDRFENYKQKATARINEVIGKHYVLPEIEAFLKNAWTDRLVFILLRDPEREDGDEWNRALAIATFLADLSALPSESSQSSIQVTDSEEIWQEIGNSLSSLGGKQPPEWGPVAALLCNPKLLLQRLTAPKKRPGGLRANPAKGSGRSTSAGVKGAAHFGETAASLEEQRMMQTLQSLEFGTWLEFCPDPNSKPERHKLSWHSSVTGRCMFVDRTGVKSKEADILWLAREVLAKRARIVEVGREPFFERALKSILRMLKGSADTNG